MQLTNSLALLFAVAYSAPSAFALPISSDSDINARDLPFELDARQVEDLQLTARDLIEQYREAREFFDELDARSFGEPEYESREFEDYLFARADTTASLNAEILKTITALEKDAALVKAAPSHPDLANVLALWAEELKTPAGEPKADKADKGVSAKKQQRKTRLAIIKGGKVDDSKVKTALKAERAYLLIKYIGFGDEKFHPILDATLKGVHIDPKLLVALPPTYLAAHPNEGAFVKFARYKNEVLYLLHEISQSTKAGFVDFSGRVHAHPNEYAADAHAELLKKKQLQNQQSAAWTKDLADIKAGAAAGTKLVEDAKKHVERLRIIAENKGNKDAAYKDAVQQEKAYRLSQQTTKPALAVATNGQTPPPVTGTGSQPATPKAVTPPGAAPPSDQKALRRRRFNYN